MTSVADIKSRRVNNNAGHNPIRFVELFGGSVTPVYNYEPDPQTSRAEYYYNSRINKLFKRIKTEGEEVDIYHWKSAAT